MGLCSCINLPWRILYLLFMGQLVSLSLALVSFTSSLLPKSGVYAPVSQSILSYLALALVYGSVLVFTRKRLQIKWYWYVLLAFADVQGRFFGNKGYQYAPITSVSLLDCFTLAWAIALTWLFLRVRYSKRHFLGAAVCVAGLLFVLLSDSQVPSSGGPRPIVGDAFVVVGTLFLAVSSIGEEFCVKSIGRVEFIAMIGGFGVLISAIQSSIFEREAIASIQWSSNIIWILLGYAAASFVFYTLSPFVLQMRGSAMFNISLLTSNIWAVLIQTFFYDLPVRKLYYLALVVTVAGIVIFSAKEETVEEEEKTEYERLDEEEATRALYHSIFWKSSLVA